MMTQNPPPLAQDQGRASARPRQSGLMAAKAGLLNPAGPLNLLK
jgi:hypothetical protein